MLKKILIGVLVLVVVVVVVIALQPADFRVSRSATISAPPEAVFEQVNDLSLCVNCDKMVGGEFEKGLAQMKSLTEVASTK